MDNNTVLRSLRYALNYNDAQMAELLALGGYRSEKGGEESLMKSLLTREDEPGFMTCSDEALIRFLDGLIVHRRGPSESARKASSPSSLSNNLILKKLRIAFELREDDMIDTFTRGGFEISGTELSALFRRPGHKNYRHCGDQLLRKFLKGLAESGRAQTSAGSNFDRRQ